MVSKLFFLAEEIVFIPISAVCFYGVLLNQALVGYPVIVISKI